MVLGVGSFAYSTAQILKEAGARVATYLTRNYGHYPPSLAGPTHRREEFPSPCPLLREKGVPEEIRGENAKWIEPTEDERLTLVSCWPFVKPDHRVVVVARPQYE